MTRDNEVPAGRRQFLALSDVDTRAKLGAAACAGREVTTIEGLADGDDLHPVQETWLEQDVAQRG